MMHHIGKLTAMVALACACGCVTPRPIEIATIGKPPTDAMVEACERSASGSDVICPTPVFVAGLEACVDVWAQGGVCAANLSQCRTTASIDTREATGALSVCEMRTEDLQLQRWLWLAVGVGVGVLGGIAAVGLAK